MQVKSGETRQRNAVVDGQTIFASQRTKDILAQWNELRDGRAAPRRGDVDPLDLFDFLPYLAMIKITEEGGDFQFSLIGTGLAKIYGLVTRQFVSRADFPVSAKEALLEGLQLCVAEHAPVLGMWEQISTVNGVKIDLEVVLLPISENGSDVSRVLGYHAITR